MEFSSFGIGGTNAHVLLSRYKEKKIKIEDKDFLIKISAKTQSSLDNYSNALLNYINKYRCKLNIANIARTLNCRAEFQYKKYFIVNSLDKLIHYISNNKLDNNMNQNLSKREEITYKHHGNLIYLPGYCFDECECLVEEDEYDFKSTDINEGISKLFKKHLEIDDISGEDDFFELGGDSISAVSLVVDIREVYKKDIHLSDFSENPTIKNITMLLSKRQKIQQ